MAGCCFVKPVEKKDDEYWKQDWFSLSSFTTQSGLLHSLMELCVGMRRVQGRHVPCHSRLREQTPSVQTQERTEQGKCGKGMNPPQGIPMFFAKVGLSFPIRSCINNQKLSKRLPLQTRALRWNSPIGVLCLRGPIFSCPRRGGVVLAKG